MARPPEPPPASDPAAPFAHIQKRFDQRMNATVAVLHPGDYYVAEPGELLTTVLGSCISACVRDERLRIGGMNHFMLPEAQTDSTGGWGPSAWVATRYGNVAMERLINEMFKRGGQRVSLEFKLIGGGKVLDALTDVGASNIRFIREYMRAEGFRVLGEDLGDLYPRKVIYDPGSGAVRVKRLARSGSLVVAEVDYLRAMRRAPPAGEIELFTNPFGRPQ